MPRSCLRRFCSAKKLVKVGSWSKKSKFDKKMKVLRMSLPILVESLSGLQESIFNLSRGPQLHFGGKSKNWSNFIKLIDFPPFPLFGVPWAVVISLHHFGRGHPSPDSCSQPLFSDVQQGSWRDVAGQWPGLVPRRALAKRDQG